MKRKSRVLLASMAAAACMLFTTGCGTDDGSINGISANDVSVVKEMAIESIEEFASMDNDTIQAILDKDPLTTVKNEEGVTEEEIKVEQAAAANWKNIKAEMGFAEDADVKVAVVGEPVFSRKNDELTVVVNIEASDSEGMTVPGSSTVVYDRNNLELDSLAFSKTESFGKLIANAGLNTLIGVGTVFMVLIFLSFLISLFKYIPGLVGGKKKEAAPKAAPAPAPVVVPVVEEEDLSDDLELVAVIAAAIAASEGAASADGYVVRSIKKRNTKKWQRA